ncbi:radical SAM peptide maturase, CXXX-repeat target family [Clostridium sp.]|uniref:radical SAM peptide maturase, CXXX-repeat target family n=1 Tax=Clostridium sp. TaxID=1506 RepID=UPI0032167067
MDNNITMGKLPTVWGDKRIKDITFSVTEECNLRCKYCYMTGKNSVKRMSFETAKKAIDYILDDRKAFNELGVIWNFIGGEPFLEMDLIDKITDYIKIRTYELNHPWFDKYRLSFSSNGILYDHPKVQEYIKKNYSHVSIGLSVDGNKEKHDLQRVKLDGTGSYDDVVKNVPLWLKQFPRAATKATFAHGDIKYLKDSIINLWNLGISEVAANVVFEDVWDEEDPYIFEEQLKALGDYILENKLWDKCTVTLFDPNKGFPLIENELKSNSCGAGRMLAIDCDGNFYPCVRFLDFSMNNRKGRKVGDIENGMDLDKVRPFLELNTLKESEDKCLKCDVATGCTGCTGFNYDCYGTIYKKATYICEMHKANVRAIEYYWDKFEKVTGMKSQRREIAEQRKIVDKQEKYMIFITSDKSTSHCIYESNGENNVMSQEIFDKGMKFCDNNNFIPVILEDNNNKFQYDGDNSLTIMKGINEREDINGVSVLSMSEELIGEDCNDACIVNVYKENIYELANFIEKIKENYSRINLIIKDIQHWSENDVEKYSRELDKLIKIIVKSYENDEGIDINVLTDIFELTEHNRCSSGIYTYALAPNGKIYMCPAVYFNDDKKYLGSIEDGILKEFKEEFKSKNLIICSKCDSYHCKNCKFINGLMTEEINMSPRIQCLISNLEKEKSYILQQVLIDNNLISRKHITNYIHHNMYKDPIEYFKIM